MSDAVGAERHPAPHRLLVSYHYARNLDLGAVFAKHFVTRPLVFGDSGAFSALTQGAAIDIGAYAEWIEANRAHLAVYANLDVICDAEATARNQRVLERRGLRPLPVFHAGSDFRHLEALCAEYRYIALGGMVGFPPARLMPWLIRCFKIARRFDPRPVFHGFGLTSVKPAQSFPWYSLDSSAWGAGYRYGRLALYCHRCHAFVTVALFDRASVAANAALIRQHGIDPAVLASRSTYHHSYAVAASARAWRRFEQALQRRWGPVRPVGADSAATGPGIHLALGGHLGPQRLPVIASAMPVGPQIFLADGDVSNHKVANAALAGPAVYLADANMNRHRIANVALTAGRDTGET